MSDINSLLSFKFHALDFASGTDRVNDHECQIKLNERIRQLKKVGLMGGKKPPFDPYEVENLLKRVKGMAEAARRQSVSFDEWTSHEMYLIAYNLTNLSDHPDAFEFAIRLLDNRWEDRFLRGLLFSLLDMWNLVKSDLQVSACRLFLSKLDSYKGLSRFYQNLKNHANFFELDMKGPLRMEKMMEAKDMDLLEAPSLLGYGSAQMGLSFYSEVIIRYVEDKDIVDLQSIDSFLKINDLERTKKMLLAFLVGRAEAKKDLVFRSQVLNYVSHKLGDGTLPSAWAPFSGVSDDEARQLELAPKIIKKWLAEKFIRLFFEVCVQDRTRKQFWLRYADSVDDFKIIGSYYYRYLLLNERGLDSDLLKKYFSTSFDDVCALALFFKDKLMIEFSVVGNALYVYQQNDAMWKIVVALSDRPPVRRIEKVAELKRTSMYTLSLFENEGRMVHIGDWQGRLDRWMWNKLGLRPK